MRFCFHLGVVAAGSLALSGASRAGSTAVPVARVDPRSGTEVRTIVVKPLPAPVRAQKPRAADPEVKDMVREAAREYDVNPALVDSVIQVESNYNPLAVSPKGAQGLMQLMPDTARRFGVRDAFDARDNINGGVKYLKFLQDTFKDDRLAIAAYNAGEGAVAKYKDVPPYPETVHYVEKVSNRYGKTKKAAKAAKPGNQALANADAKPAGPPEPQYLPVRQYLDAEGRIHLTTQ